MMSGLSVEIERFGLYFFSKEQLKRTKKLTLSFVVY